MLPCYQWNCCVIAPPRPHPPTPRPLTLEIANPVITYDDASPRRSQIKACPTWF